MTEIKCFLLSVAFLLLFHKKKKKSNANFDFIKLSHTQLFSGLHVLVLILRVIVAQSGNPGKHFCVFSHMWESHEIGHFLQREGRLTMDWGRNIFALFTEHTENSTQF